MKTPFEILGVSDSSTDEEIKKVYLQKVRQYSPEREPEQFQVIRAAFEAIKTQQQRLKYQLFSVEVPNIENMAEHILRFGTPCQITKEVFTKALLESFHKSKN